MSPAPASAMLRHLLPTEPRMALTVGTEGIATLITVRGELDMSTTPLIAEIVVHVLRRRPPQLVMDLSRVTFFSAHGISTLLSARSETIAAGVDFVMRDPAPCVTYLLAVTGVLPHLRQADGASAGPTPVPVTRVAAGSAAARSETVPPRSPWPAR